MDENQSNSSGNLHSNSNLQQPQEQQQTCSLQQLARAIAIPQNKVLQICNSQQQLRTKLKEFNDAAVIKIENQEYNEALIYLQEAEKILDAAVTRGNKKIDRIFIICTLQNEACAYQRLWELEKSAQYMEAIIHNMQCEVQINTSAQLQQIYFSEEAPDDRQTLKQTISKLTLMGLYYLEYLAVTSQIKDHQTAYQTSANALRTFKKVCEKCYLLEKLSPDHSESIFVQAGMLRQLAQVNEQPQIQKIPDLIKQAKRALQKMKQSLSSKKSMTDKTIICFGNFSIGQVMQISPITQSELIQKINSKQELTNINKLYKALYISICFFSMATQKRLMCTQVSRKHKNRCSRSSEPQIQISETLKHSQIFHLKSIIIACSYIPCENKYLSHIIKSLKNHYEIDLLENVSDLVEQVSSIDLQSQHMITSSDKNDHTKNTNINPNNFTIEKKLDKCFKSEPIKINKTKNVYNADYSNHTPFGNTLIKKQIEYHYENKVTTQEKQIKTLFAENIKQKLKRQISRSKSKSSKKKNSKHSKDSRKQKKQINTMYSEKHTDPTTMRSVDKHPKMMKSKSPPNKKKQKFSEPQISHHSCNGYQQQHLLFSEKQDIKQKKPKLKKKKAKEQLSKQKSKQRTSKSKSCNSKKGLNTPQEDKNKKKTKVKHNRLSEQYLLNKDGKGRKSSKTSGNKEHKFSLKKKSIRVEESSHRNIAYTSKNSIKTSIKHA